MFRIQICYRKADGTKVCLEKKNSNVGLVECFSFLFEKIVRFLSRSKMTNNMYFYLYMNMSVF